MIQCFYILNSFLSIHPVEILSFVALEMKSNSSCVWSNWRLNNLTKSLCLSGNIKVKWCLNLKSRLCFRNEYYFCNLTLIRMINLDLQAFAVQVFINKQTLFLLLSWKGCYKLLYKRMRYEECDKHMWMFQREKLLKEIKKVFDCV